MLGILHKFKRYGLRASSWRSFGSLIEQRTIQVRQQLKLIKDDQAGNVEESGMLHSVQIKGENQVQIKLRLTKEFRKVKSLIEKQLRAELPWVGKIDIDLAPRPKEASSVKHEGLAGVKRVLAVSSCKGGVGKSTVAVNLAYSFQKLGLKVGLLDADIYGPSLPTMVSPSVPRLYADSQNAKLIAPVQFGGVKVISYGFAAANRRAVMRGPMVSQVVRQLATQTNWGELDTLVVDFPPGTGDIQITLCQELPLGGAVIVTTPQKLSFVDVVKGIEMFDELRVPTLAVVQNMAYFACPKCAEPSYPFGRGFAQQLQEQFGILNSFQLQIESQVSHYSDNGTPFVTVLPDEIPVVKTFSEIAKSVLKEAETARQQAPDVSYEPRSGMVVVKTEKENVQIPARTLRLACRCALCVQEMTGIRKLKDGDVPQDVYPLKMEKKGNYAVAVVWSDGHNTSLYPYTRLLDENKLKL